MRHLRHRWTFLFAWALLGAGCTTGFELRARPDAAAVDAAVDAGTDAGAPDAGPDAGAAGCRAAGDRCCSEAPRGAFCVGGLVCSEGYCAPCPGALFACGNACVDLQTNGRNCGACGTACAEGERCAGGSCVLDCAPPRVVCGGRCVDPTADAAHCGACDRACAAGPNAAGRCVAGACQRTCAAGFADCDGAAANGCEVDTRADAGHCGACGAACALPRAVRVCVAGACAVAACEVGYQDCDRVAGNGCEVDINRDVANCGACGRACAAMQVCRTGACVPAATTCAPGRADCAEGAEACETPTATDPQNCGGCGRVCAFAHAAASCAAGACVLGACAVGYGDCDGVAANGCEARTSADPANCGACRRACAASRGQAACVAGACAVASCDAGWADCDGAAANGCEVDLGASASHCGGCGRACAPAHATGACAAGTCTVSACAAGFADCDGSAANGCEAETATDPARCGGCATVCAYPRAAATCAAGACVLGACAAGFGNCDGVAANGCETHLDTSTASCGACGRACAFEHATAACAGGACAIGACAAGWGNCDGVASNGCEASLSSSGAHCGACGRACAAGQSCSGGDCVVVCPPGQEACGSACVNVSNDAAHCGACGRVCAAGPNQRPFCRGAACYAECDAGWGDCDGSAANGCEANLSSDRGHCGQCGRACEGGQNAEGICDQGTCRLACAMGYADCNGALRDGCEVALNGDPAHCGSCGAACPAPSVDTPHVRAVLCTAGACSLACEGGWADCDRVAANGCEADLSTNTSCGGCGRQCARVGGTLNQSACCNRAGVFRCCSGFRGGVGVDVCSLSELTCN